MKKLVALMLLAVIGGCATAPMSFSKQGTSSEQMKQDVAACEYDVKSKNVNTQLLGYQLQNLIEKCMSGKGYTVQHPT